MAGKTQNSPASLLLCSLLYYLVFTSAVYLAHPIPILLLFRSGSGPLEVGILPVFPWLCCDVFAFGWKPGPKSHTLRLFPVSSLALHIHMQWYEKYSDPLLQGKYQYSNVKTLHYQYKPCMKNPI